MFKYQLLRKMSSEWVKLVGELIRKGAIRERVRVIERKKEMRVGRSFRWHFDDKWLCCEVVYHFFGDF